MVVVNERLKPFRFIPLQFKRKIPISSWTDWVNRGLKWDDAFLVEHVRNGGNYGVLTGHGLTVLDVDPAGIEAGVLVSVKRCLVDTFTVRTPRGGRHFYYICDSPSARLVGGLFGDVKGLGGQVVGPGCAVDVETSKGRYVVENNVPLHQVSVDELFGCLRQWIKKEVEPKPVLFVPRRAYGRGERPSIRDELCLAGFHRSCTNPSWYVGTNPVHGSSTGRNMSVNVDTGMWRCWRCDMGGDVFQWIAVREGWASCGQKLGKDLFLKVLNYWKKLK